jgi:hypothetical protein
MAEQSYGNPASRNTARAAGGTIPSKVSVPLPGTNATQKPYTGGQAKAPAGFKGGVIPGKI